MSKNILSFLIIIGLCSAVFTPLFVHFPFLQDTFTDESLFLETTTMLLYVIGVVIAGVVVKHATSKITRRHGFFVGAASLFWFLEETSFGRDFFYRYDRPEFYGMKLDSVHDLVELGVRMAKDNTKDFESIFFFAMVGAVIAVLLFFAWQNRDKLITFCKTPSAVFIIIGLVALIVAGAIDVAVERDQEFLIYLEELFEFYAAVAMVFAAWILLKDNFTLAEKDRDA